MSVCIAFVYWLPVGLLILYGRAILRMRRRGKVGKPSDLARFNVVVIMGTAGLAIGRLAFQLSNWAEIIVIGALWSAAVIAYFALQDYRETRVCV
jgi:hypothetical protein